MKPTTQQLTLGGLVGIHAAVLLACLYGLSPQRCLVLVAAYSALALLGCGSSLLALSAAAEEEDEEEDEEDEDPDDGDKDDIPEPEAAPLEDAVSTLEVSPQRRGGTSGGMGQLINFKDIRRK